MIVWAWHIHHEGWLCEPLTQPIEERIRFIQMYKQKAEVPIRLRLLKQVKGEVPPALSQIFALYEDAYVAWKQADAAAWKQVDAAAWKQADAAWEQTCDAWKQVGAAWERLDAAYMEVLPELEALHRKECLNCPWDGQTIFPKKGSN